MSIATGAGVRVSPMRLCDVLSLYVDPRYRRREWEQKLSELWGEHGVCVRCYITIAPAADVLWDGRKGGLAHAGHINNRDAVPWGEVFLPGYSRSVAERLKLKEEEREQMRAQAVA